MPLRIAFFGLPLGALVLAARGFRPGLCVLSPVPAPGARRLGRLSGVTLLDAAALGSELTARVDAALAREPPDLLVSWFWTRRLPPGWLGAARLGAIGAHPSLLPRHRGPNPYFWAIDSGDLETGVSVHRLEEEYDTGAILRTERLTVGLRNAWQLARALDRPSLQALAAVIEDLAAGEAIAELAQDEGQASLAPEPAGAELRVDFCWPTERVLRRVRALSPAPGLALELAGVEFFVTGARAAARFVASLEPGEAQLDADRVVLRTGDGAIAIERAVRVGHDGETEALAPEVLAALVRERLESR